MPTKGAPMKYKQVARILFFAFNDLEEMMHPRKSFYGRSICES